MPRRRRRPSAMAAALALALLFPAGAACARKPAADPACLAGVLKFEHRDAEAGPEKPWATETASAADWELWSGTSQLATGRTDADGTFVACGGESSYADMRLRFPSASGDLSEVVTDRTKRARHTFDSATVTDVVGRRDVGVVEVPKKMASAWHIIDTLGLLYAKRAGTSSCWTRQCERLTVVWGPAPSDDAGYFDQGGTDAVILAGDMPDSEHVVLHEAGHWFQWELYGHWLPEADNCQVHFVESRSSPTCAWVEGFPDALAAYTLGDRRFVHEDGNAVAIDPDASWDTGDAVQGRVAGALLDLWAGPDGGTWDATIALMSHERSSTFDEYFAVDRPTADPPLSTTGEAAEVVEEWGL
ncbi:metalloprotease [Phytomonospora endophytica]|uniref:Metalloprotease n=1 Tax=Phytomonospora endophytica TaxID=714109 RepID=A0A841FIE3_9ACTN|nr:metalloprotease [Phytomonospora endophytica]MBB6032907.1 hypothetical protein [Phytomonospora endophytica]GIG65133.1 hypothetical protein Pen01_14280 [Phytomonospora endophytica]